VESLEAFDRLKGEFAELVERFNDGFTLERCSWSALIFNAYSESMGLVDRRQNQAMLVDTIKLGKFPQQKLTSLVRLYLVKDERREVGEGLLYRSVMCGLRYYVVPRSADWQGHPVHAGNSDHDVVERGSQVMNGIPDDQRNAGWKLCYADDLDALLSGLEIVLDSQSCEVRIQKGSVLIDKFVDVALGSLGF
jgi:hypothetical protein